MKNCRREESVSQEDCPCLEALKLKREQIVTKAGQKIVGKGMETGESMVHCSDPQKPIMSVVETVNRSLGWKQFGGFF